MTNPDRVFAFLVDHVNQPFCDDCISKGADVAPRQAVNVIASTLALTREFERDKGDLFCCECREFKTVTTAITRA